MSQRIKQGAPTPPLNEGASTSTTIKSTPPRRELHKVAPKRLGRGVRISSQSKMIVEKVRQHFEKEREQGGPIKMSCVVERTAVATGLAVRTVFSIHKEFISCDEHFLTPVKRYASSRVRINPDSFDRAVIRRVVHGFYLRKEYPTLSKVLGKVKEACSFPGGKFCLWRVLWEMGFAYIKRDSKRFIYEQEHVIGQRHTYLKTIQKLRDENRPLIFMDETWVNAHHTLNYIWIDNDEVAGFKVPSGKGGRLIVVHAGSKDGWVTGAELVFKSKTSSDDYHDEMNSEHYMDWFTNNLLPNVPDNSVIVIDHAPYHDKQKDKPPTTNNRKGDIRKWLDEHNITYSDKDIKKTLLEIVKQHRPTPTYLTNEATRLHGRNITVLRLPVAHCELNAIELAWAWVKRYVAEHNQKFTLTEVQRLTSEAFDKMPSDMWGSFCKHVLKVEERYREEDSFVEDKVEEMMFEIGGEDDESDDEDDMIDNYDKQLIDRSLLETTKTVTDTCTTPRRDLTETMKGFDPDFLESVLPLD